MAVHVESAFSVKEGNCQENDFVDDKVNIFETVVIVDNAELEGKLSPGKIEQIDIPFRLDNIKMESPTSDVQCDPIHETVKIEEGGISANDIKFEFNNGLLHCEECHAYYKDYCTKCGMLVRVLNGNNSNSSDNISRAELPNDVLEVRNYFGQRRIFASKVIPEGVIFGPFTGLNRTGCQWRIEGGKFVVNEDELEYLNWMQYINSARNVSEQNLLTFQYEHNLYYQSTCLIEEGDELLVYFGEEYEDSLNRKVDMDFIPSTRCVFQDVFACTFCCLGFNSKWYLAKHKTVCPEGSAGQFSIEDLIQCLSCKIHLDQKEYFQHRMAHYCKLNDRKCNQTADVTGRKMERQQSYECGVCANRTEDPQHRSCVYIKARIKEESPCSQGEMKQFKAKRRNQFNYDRETDHQEKLEYHFNDKHSNELRYKCDMCDFRANQKSNLNRHIKTRHLKQFKYKCEMCVFETNLKSSLENHVKEKHLKEFNYRCDECAYKTYRKSNLNNHVSVKHLKELNYKCDLCGYRTSRKSNLKVHVKTKHLNEFNYRCDACDYTANHKSRLEVHVKAKHLNEFNYECDKCDYKASHKHSLLNHVKGQHLREFNYQCDACDYKSNLKSNFKLHVKAKHLKEYNYKCERCDYRTNQRSHVENHVRAKHSREFQYKCDSCDYQANFKCNLKRHVETKHLKEFKYKCGACEYKTNVKFCLKRHTEIIHSREFKYKCGRCDYKANLKCSLECHMKTKHLEGCT